MKGEFCLNYPKLQGETERQYIWRLHHFVRQGTMTWRELADNVNREYREDPTEYRTECAYRKSVTAAEAYYEDVFSKLKNEEYQNQIQEDVRLIQKEKQKLRDERTEYNRLIRSEARKESYADMVKKIVSQETKPYPIHIADKPDTVQKNSLLIHLTDIHTGIEIDNFYNLFNEKILIERLSKYCNEIINIQRQHQSERAYIVIGEIVSGIIHNNLRIQNNLDLMEQFKLISEQIASMLVRLSEYFQDIFVYVTPGNHSRISPKKEDALDGENLDLLLPFYLEAKLQNYKDIHIENNPLDKEVAIFTIYDIWVMAAHGHKDSPVNVVQNFTLMFGQQPNIVLLGHRHTNGLTTVFDTKVIQSGCVSGTDEYALGVRKCGSPEQTVSVVDKEGLRCIYDIKL